MKNYTETQKKESDINFLMEEEEISTKESIKQLLTTIRPYLKRIWNARYKIIIVNSIIFVLTLLYLLFVAKPFYKSTVTILPEYGSKTSALGGLSGLAAMAGVSVGSGSSTEIYETLIKSESVLEPVIYAKYNTKEFDKPVNLIEYFEIELDESLSKEQSERKAFLEVYKDLTKERLSTGIDKMTKVLEVTVEMPESKLSAEVANGIANSLDNYVRTQRKSYASEQRLYLDKRISQVEDSLNHAENIFADFKSRNRVVEQSPSLMLKQVRMAREVEIMQTVYIELTKQLELAKIEEIKDSPILNIKEKAKEPVLKAGPKRLNKLIAFMFLGLLLTSAYFAFNDDLKTYKNILTEK